MKKKPENLLQMNIKDKQHYERKKIQMVTKYMKKSDEIISHHNEKVGCISRKSTIKKIEYPKH